MTKYQNSRPNRWPRLGCPSAGFTLIEALVALLIFAFSLAGLSYLLSSGIQNNTHARRMTAATTLAQQRLDELRNRTYSAVVSSAISESLTEAGATTGPTFYARSWTVSDNSPMANTKTVQVTVTWTDKAGNHQTMLQTIITP